MSAGYSRSNDCLLAIRGLHLRSVSYHKLSAGVAIKTCTHQQQSLQIGLFWEDKFFLVGGSRACDD